MSTTRPERPSRQHGIGILAAIIVLFVIAGLVATLTRLTATQAVSFALDERGVRAYWAARSGLEWGSYQWMRINSCVESPTTVAMPAAATSLAEYQVTVTCTGSGPHLLTATASSGTPGTATYVQRIITRTLP